MKNFITKPFWLFLILVFLLWNQLALHFNELILPSPAETLAELNSIIKSGVFVKSLFITLKRTLIGYLAAVISGSFLAVVMKKFNFLKRGLRPFITIIQAAPPVVWIALAVVWFGVAEDLTPIFLIFIVSMPVIFVNIFQGIESIDYDLVEMAEAYSIPKYKIFRDIYLPGILPSAVSALSIAFSFAWKSSVFAEFIGSSSGIGYQLSMANSNLETAELFAWTAVLVVFMLFVEYFLLERLKKKVSRWRYEE
ncbi:MAG: ABC transporter permease [Bacillota bacterium]